MSKYVQHKSGVGEKWEVVKEITDPPMWGVRGPADSYAMYWYPKSEYIEVPEPEVWVDVTKDVRVRRQGGLKGAPGIEMGEFVSHEVTDLAKLICPGNYRIRKVQLYTPVEHTAQLAFLVEKQVKP